MSVITIANILVTLTALFAYLNFKFFKLPPTIGIMAVALLASVVIFVLHGVGLDIQPLVGEFLGHIDFTETLMHGMLSFLLFAGALHVNISDLASQKRIVGLMATIGTVFSTFVVGIVSYYLFAALGFEIPLIYALLFGALISPTDPIAVMAILKKAGVPKSLETKVVGESLFNDGIAVVIFTTLLAVAVEGHVDAGHVAIHFVQEAIGGAVLGFGLGFITYRLLHTVDNYELEILLTLALVMGGYELALLLHSSGPIAMVVAGLFIGNKGRSFAMSDKTRENLDHFWELIDEFLNAVLFLLLGLAILVLPFNQTALMAGLIMIPTLLGIRLVAVWLPVTLLKKWREFSTGVVKILTWAGLRGGISVALVLSLPQGDVRDFLLLVTYCIVLFSILVQGLTIEKLVKSTVSPEHR